ncbi:MAG TPA: hypothetical protein VJB87_03740 [Candidatus Nanoarchaeia archaeon]|nr:hypothetical protein [Candidatus Nanoarchaeia archaeon]
MRNGLTISLIALLVLAVIPLGVFADSSSGRIGVRGEVKIGDDDNEVNTQVESDSELESESDNDDRQEVESDIDINDDRREARAELKVRLKGIRVEARDKSQRLRMEFREKVNGERAEFREKLKECKQVEVRAAVANVVAADVQGKIAACESFRAEVKSDIVANVEVRAEQWIAYLERLKARVAASDIENKAEITAKIDADIVRIKAVTDRINENSSAAEVKAAVKELKVIWSESKVRAKAHALVVVNHGLWGVTQRGDKLEDRLETRIAELKAKGYDTTTAEAELADFEAHLDASADARAEAEVLLKAGSTEEAREVLKEARAELQEAHQSLQAYVQAVKEISVKSETDVEVEQ